MSKFHFNTKRQRNIDLNVQNYFEGEGHFSAWRKNNEGITESKKRTKRKITNIKKYSSRAERRKVNQKLHTEI